MRNQTEREIHKAQSKTLIIIVSLFILGLCTGVVGLYSIGNYIVHTEDNFRYSMLSSYLCHSKNLGDFIDIYKDNVTYQYSTNVVAKGVYFVNCTKDSIPMLITYNNITKGTYGTNLKDGYSFEKVIV